MSGKEARNLGEWGERLVARLFGYKPQPGSGNRWPRKQDLYSAGLGRARRVAQVKTTTVRTLVDGWTALESYAKAEGAEPHFYIVVKAGQVAHVFEVHLERRILLGIGGDS